MRRQGATPWAARCPCRSRPTRWPDVNWDHQRGSTPVRHRVGTVADVARGRNACGEMRAGLNPEAGGRHSLAPRRSRLVRHSFAADAQRTDRPGGCAERPCDARGIALSDNVAGGSFSGTRATMGARLLRPRPSGFLRFQDEGGTFVSFLLAERRLVGPDSVAVGLEHAWLRHLG
jgi:hypothetical protein